VEMIKLVQVILVVHAVSVVSPIFYIIWIVTWIQPWHLIAFLLIRIVILISQCTQSILTRWLQRWRLGTKTFLPPPLCWS
jgi:hypothetical protein